MKSIQLVALSALVLSLGFTPALSAESKPKYAASAVRLALDHEYINKSKAPDYWALSPYYVSQRDSSACSLASFAMLLNALKSSLNLTASDELITQDKFVEKLKDHPAMKRFFMEKGKSISLDEFAEIASRALVVYGIKGFKVDAIHANGSRDFIRKTHDILVENEVSSRNFIVANFLQSEFTGDEEGAVGHVAPVAAFDARKSRVLIMDPDRVYYEPYWVSVDAFIKGMNTIDKDGGKTRGFLWIHE